MKRKLRNTLFLLLLPLCLPASADDRARLAEKVLLWLTTAQGDSILSHCTAEVRAQMPAATLNALWQQVQLQTGTLERRGQWRHTTKDGYDIHSVTLASASTALDFNVVVDSESRIAGFTFTPAASVPQDNAEETTDTDAADGAWTEREVTIENGAVHLPGTLTLPREWAAGKRAVVVMAAGSGPCDRDETTGPNKPLRDIAHQLAAKGIASLRYDKRTAVYGARTAEVSGGKLDFDTEVADDAAQALSVAAQIPEMRKGKVFLLGHSLGAALAPRIVEKAEKAKARPAGVIMLAAPARPLAELMAEQLRYVVSLSGLSPKLAAAQADTLYARAMAALPAEYREEAMSYRPAADAAKLSRCPLLFIQGGNDYQVTQKDYDLWMDAVEAVKEEAVFRFLPSLDHLLRPQTQMAIPADYTKKGKVDTAATDEIADFVQRHAQ